MSKIRQRKVNKLCCLLAGMAFFLSGCSFANSPASFPAAGFEVTMEMTKDYDDSDPFVNESLFFVTENADDLKLEISLRLDGESAALEIGDNNTDEVLWSGTWEEAIEDASFTISLNLQKTQEYVIRFTGTKINYAKVTVKSSDSLIKGRTRPLEKPSSKKESAVPSGNQSGTFFNYLTVTDKDNITSEFDGELDGDNAVFLVVEVTQDLEATAHYTYTTYEKDGAAWGYYLEGADEKASFELHAGTGNVYENFWTDETLLLQKGTNIFYVSGSDISCKMHFEITGIDKEKVSYVSAFTKNQALESISPISTQ